MEISLTQEMIELHQSFTLLNYKLYKFKYGDTVEGKRRLELYYRILKTIHELASKKIANLDSLQTNLGLVFPMIPIPVLEELADNLKNLTSGVLDVTIYTNILFYMAAISTCLNQQMIGIVSVFKMLRAGKRSRLDDLECKQQVIEIFKKIKELEKTNTAQGRTSAFATVFQQELRPLLKDTDYFKEHPEPDIGYEQTYRVNNRAYKIIKKLYHTWKKNSVSKLEKALIFFDNLWHMSWQASPKGMDITPKVQSSFIDFVKNIDEIISNEK